MVFPAVLVGLSVASNLILGASERRVRNQRAAILERQALQEIQIGLINAERLRRGGQEQTSGATAAAAAAGIDAGSGSPVAAIAAFAGAVEMDARMTEVESRMRAARLRADAGFERSAGKQAVRGAVFRGVAGGISILGESGAFDGSPSRPRLTLGDHSSGPEL